MANQIFTVAILEKNFFLHECKRKHRSHRWQKRIFFFGKIRWFEPLKMQWKIKHVTKSTISHNKRDAMCPNNSTNSQQDYWFTFLTNEWTQCFWAPPIYICSPSLPPPKYTQECAAFSIYQHNKQLLPDVWEKQV